MTRLSFEVGLNHTGPTASRRDAPRGARNPSAGGGPVTRSGHRAARPYPATVTVLRIRMVGDPVLHRPTRPVASADLGEDELRTLVDDMFETMAAANGVGLAANQVGIDLRLFVFDCPDPETRTMRRGHVLDPVLETGEIPEIMPDPDEDQEGCLSVPGESVATGRADWARVTGTDVDGNPVDVEGKGFLARCLQHEVDHLDGRLYLDRLMGRNQRGAKKMLRRNGWGGPSDSWDPSAVDAEDVPRG